MSASRAGAGAAKRGIATESLGCHAIPGTADGMLEIRCADVEACEPVPTHALLRSPRVRVAVPSFSLCQIKRTSALPL